MPANHLPTADLISRAEQAALQAERIVEAASKVILQGRQLRSQAQALHKRFHTVLQKTRVPLPPKKVDSR
jgi:hypothetical protein